MVAAVGSKPARSGKDRRRQPEAACRSLSVSVTSAELRRVARTPVAVDVAVDIAVEYKTVL